MAIQFFFFFWLGHDLGRRLGPNLARLNGTHGAREKNPVSKRARFGPRAKTCRSGPGMEKPGLNPTRCHSYLEEFHDPVL